MLSGVNEHFAMPRAKTTADGGDLHELGSRADDSEDGERHDQASVDEENPGPPAATNPRLVPARDGLTQNEYKRARPRR